MGEAESEDERNERYAMLMSAISSLDILFMWIEELRERVAELERRLPPPPEQHEKHVNDAG